MTQFIGIAGKAGTGKSTLAKLLLELALDRSHRWTRFGFADLLKLEVSERFGIDPQLCYTSDGKATKVQTGRFGELTVRELLQLWGTDVCRGADPNHWVKKMDATFPAENPYDGIIVDDVRFPNEAEWIKDRGGELVYLFPYPGWEPGPHAYHESETALDGYAGFDSVYTPGYGELQGLALSIAGAV